MEPIRMDLEGYECPCPSHPHTSEWLDLEPAVTIPMGMAAMAVIDRSTAETEPELYGDLAPTLLRFGIRAWSFTDEKGGHVTISSDSIAQLLPFGLVGYEVSNRCMGLYLAELMRPLARRQARRLGFTQTASSTSPISPSGPRPPTPLSRSSRKRTAGKRSEGPGL